jgi:UDP-N-acetylglucosamine diphosphorylase/glucosamine-1-phosphate N-acetyltransferase
MKAIVLAGGKGTRLNSAEENIPKVMRTINNKVLIEYCLNSIDFIDKKDIVIVVGFQKEKVREHLGEEYTYCYQEQQLGTGHAALCTKDILEGIDDDVIIIYGDMPLVKKETFEGLIKRHKKNGTDMTILTAVVDNILPYGRIIRSVDNRVIDIIEEKDTDEETRLINELNVGVVVVKIKYLYEGLAKIKNNNHSKEYYLTDLTKVFVQGDKKIETYTTYDESEIRGINTMEDLCFAVEVLKIRWE